MNIFLNKLNENDLELLRKWRMKENVTKYMLTDPKITMEQQVEWYNAISNDTSRIDLTINVDKTVVGHYYITNIDNNSKSCQVGFYIGDDKYRGKGIYTSVQIAMNDFIFNVLSLDQIFIYTFDDNPNCNKYSSLGFKEDKTKRYIYIKYDKEHYVNCYSLKKDEYYNIIDNKNVVKINY